MTKSIVISGPPAVGKTTVAKGLAKEFDLKYLSGGDVLKEMAKEQGFDSDGDDWWDTEEGMKFLNQREENSEFDKNLDKKLTDLFNQGGMVITSYTLPWLIQDGVKIWLEGSHASSTERMQSRDNMSSENAYEITKTRFDKNKALYKKLYGFSFGDDKAVFDVIINTDNLTANQVIDVTTETVRKTTMTLKQLENLIEIDQDITDDAYGTYYDKRTIEQLLNNGIILLDKPPGPTSHETVAWTKRILKLDKIGHSGTLDPQVSGVLPLGLGEATKALGVLLYGPKEYHALGRVHSLPSKEKLAEIIEMFTGEIFQKPPQRSAVVRQTRTRTIYELELIEQKERLLLTRILCELGTYIRKLYYDIGEVLGPGATMVELRRSRVDQFHEKDGLVTLHELADAFAIWEEKKDDSKLMEMIKPVEFALSELKSVVIRDSAVDAMCHGAQLAIPGVLKISSHLKSGDIVGIYTQKGEAVALAESTMDEEEICDATKGYAFVTKRIIMAPNTYPKKWRTKPTAPKD